MTASTLEPIPNLQTTTSHCSYQSSTAPNTPADEYDPCALAKPCSPFYLYNHDSPRPSMDHRPKQSLSVSIRDLENGQDELSPTVSQEKLESQKKVKPSKFNFWEKGCKLRTTPKKKGCIARLPKKQRVLARIAIAVFIIGCMVGIAVGIAVGLKSGVWKSNGQVGQIAN